jgi:hypothetical protein
MVGWPSPLPLDDHETAEDALQVFVLVACHDELIVESSRNKPKRWPGSRRRR